MTIHEQEQFNDYKCAQVLFEVVKNFTLETEGSYIPVHVPAGIGFMQALSSELSKFVTLKAGVVMKELPLKRQRGSVKYEVIGGVNKCKA